MSKTKAEIQAIIDQKNLEAKNFYNMEQAVKLTLNSIYGAFGNEYFYFFNIDMAESITLQGQDAILFTERILNEYFQNFWHKDTKLHDHLGITIQGPNIRPSVIYIDTDSCYVSFEECFEKCNWEGDEREFIQKIYKFRLKGYIETVLQRYADANNCENFLKFEMETIAKRGIWLSKKKYIQDIVWTDPDINFDSLSKVKAKGFEIIQSSTPTFARSKLKDLLTYIFSVDRVELSGLVGKLKEIKKEFRLTNIDNISMNVNINNYTKYIVDDYKTFEFAKGCPMHVRGIGYHNYLLNNSVHKNKYGLVGSGEKVKCYYSMDPNVNTFSYSAGSYPYEIAPQVDYDLQFEKTIIDPINRVIKAIGLQPLDRNLIYAAAVF